MIPLLFSADESAYSSHGFGPIRGATSCLVTEEANGAYELKLTVPRTCPRLPQLVGGNQILVPPNPFERPQPFRIKRVTKGQRNELNIYAQHLCYDLAGVTIGAFTASTAAEAVALLNSRRLAGDSFSFSTDLDVRNPMTVSEPTAAWDLLGSGEDTLTYNYGGELRFDRREVQLLQARGADRGFVIAYGKNLTELTHEESVEKLYTGVLPFWTSGDGVIVTGDVQNAVSGLGYTKILPVDMSGDFEEQPSVVQLNAAGATYIKEKKVGEPKLRIKASFVPPGSRGIQTLEDVRLWDRVTLRHELLQIEVEASVVRTVYDVLRERYQNVEIGNRLVSVAQTIAAPVTRIAKNAVTAKTIARSSVSGASLKARAVTSPKIGPGAVNSAALALGAVTEPKIGQAAVTSAKVGPLAILNDKIAPGAVSYGKTSFTGTLDQVGVNKANIEAINGYFTGTANFASVTASNFFLNGYQHQNGSVYIDGLRYQVVTWREA